MTKTKQKIDETESKLSRNVKLQLFLMDFEAALFTRCPKCGQLVRKDWSPQKWADKLETLILEERQRNSHDQTPDL